MRLTRRGKRVVAVTVVLLAAALLLLASATPDACLTRGGYVACQTLER